MDAVTSDVLGEAKSKGMEVVFGTSTSTFFGLHQRSLGFVGLVMHIAQNPEININRQNWGAGWYRNLSPLFPCIQYLVARKVALTQDVNQYSVSVL